MKKPVSRFVMFFICSLLLPVSSWGAVIGDYCMTPPFIQQGIKANLLMLIDNSASMYDLAYQDTSHKYCANNPANVCTANSDCTGSATCVSSVTTATATVYSAKVCTTDAQCPLSPTITTTNPKVCTLDSQCNSGLSGDGCAIPHGSTSGVCKKTNTTTTTHPCNSGYCNACNTTTGVGDCTATVAAVSTPVACTADSTCSAITSGDTCNNKCSINRQCYDTTYSGSTTYTGYFTSTDTYAFDMTNNKFTGSATMPNSCTYSAGTYLCVNTTGTGTAELLATDGTGFTASGNFLNWLTASKFDEEKQILTGGKFDTTGNVLIGESRGCAGRTFVKSVPVTGLQQITFGIRGGTPIAATQNQATDYGQTFIDINVGTYNAPACLSAANDWTLVASTNPPSLGNFQNDTKGCVGSTGTLASSTVTAVSFWNHILHDCYQGLTGGAQGYSTNLLSLEGECQSIYSTPLLPSAITDPNVGYAICSSVLSYNDPAGVARTGYLGACWNGTSFTTGAACGANPLTDLEQMTNYCKLNVSSNPVVDPSSTALTGAAASAPGFILEQGLLNTHLIGTMPVQVAATAPTGLIDRFKNSIRFGAMVFNIDGSASECNVAGSNIPCAKYCSVTTSRLCYVQSDCLINGVQEICGSITNKDAGKIIAFVGEGTCSATTATACKVDIDCPANEYCVASIGDHSSGLIKAIDDVKATTWTPHAEAFYNAVAYYTKDATATNALLPAGFAPSTASSSAAKPIDTYLAGSDSFTNKNPIQYRCQQNNILIITDGAATADKNGTMTAKVTDASGNFRDPVTTSETTSCGSYAGTPYLHDLSYYARHKNIFVYRSCFGIHGCLRSVPSVEPYRDKRRHHHVFGRRSVSPDCESEGSLRADCHQRRLRHRRLYPQQQRGERRKPAAGRVLSGQGVQG